MYLKTLVNQHFSANRAVNNYNSLTKTLLIIYGVFLLL